MSSMGLRPQYRLGVFKGAALFDLWNYAWVHDYIDEIGNEEREPA